MVTTADVVKVLRARVRAPTLGAVLGLVIGLIVGAQVGGIGVALMGTAFGIPGVLVMLVGGFIGYRIGRRIDQATRRMTETVRRRSLAFARRASFRR
jgi:uncharacterized protein YcfJ